MIFGFGTGLISETTQLLFTMGKAKYRADCNQFGSSTRRSNQAISEPIFEYILVLLFFQDVFYIQPFVLFALFLHLIVYTVNLANYNNYRNEIS